MRAAGAAHWLGRMQNQRVSLFAQHVDSASRVIRLTRLVRGGFQPNRRHMDHQNETLREVDAAPPVLNLHDLLASS